MIEALPFRAGILKIMKFNMEVDSRTVHERTSTDYELDLYIGGSRSMSINGKSFFVSPKESDVITQEVAKLLASSISLAFTGGY